MVMNGMANLQLLKAKDNLEKGCKLDFNKKEA
jgi:hypothetical protein